MTGQQTTEALVEALAKQVAPLVLSQIEQGEGVRPRLLTVEGAARYLSVTENAIRHMVRRRQLRRAKLPGYGRVLVDRLELDEMIEAGKQ